MELEAKDGQNISKLKLFFKTENIYFLKPTNLFQNRNFLSKPKIFFKTKNIFQKRKYFSKAKRLNFESQIFR